MQGREFFQIMIRNSLSEESLRQEETKLFQSKKEDKRNHGLGLDNVRREIEKKGGKLELKKEDFSYCAIATLKQVKTVR
jgi:signal transduction histidine kinase